MHKSLCFFVISLLFFSSDTHAGRKDKQARKVDSQVISSAKRRKLTSSHKQEKSDEHNSSSDILSQFPSVQNLRDLREKTETTQKLSSHTEKPYISPDYWETERLKLARVRSAQSDIDCYKVLFANDGHKTNWFTKFTLREDPKNRLKFLQQREKLGYYQLPISFSHYNIHSKTTNTLIGRFCFIEQGKKDSIETGIYLVKSARKKGYGQEALAGVLEKIIKPALGKPFYTDDTRDIDPKYETLSKDDFKLTYHSKFSGVIAKSDTFHNYGSLAVHYRAGFGVKWVKHVSWMVYPPSEDAFLSKTAVTSLLDITKTFSTVADDFTKAFQMFNSKEEMGRLSLNDIIPLLNSEDFKKEASYILERLKTLFQTDELHTLISVLDLWIALEADPDELPEFISIEKAKRLLSFSVAPRNSYYQSVQLMKKHQKVITSLATSKEGL